MDFGKKNVGNFTILKYKKDGVDRIKVSNNDDSWSVEFAMTHIMYAVIDAMKEESDFKALSILFTSWYGVTTIYNVDFVVDVNAAIDKFIRLNSDTSVLTEEENDNDRVALELEEELKKVEEEYGTDSEHKEGSESM